MGRTKVKKRKKPGPPRTTGKGHLIGVRVLPPLLVRIDDWSRKQDGEPSRPDAMRRLIEMGLASARPPAPRASAKVTAKASQLAGQMIDVLGDGSAPAEEREKRKRRLLRGPREFREMREDLPKPKR